MENLICYKQMPVWTKATLPQMFQEKHNTKSELGKTHHSQRFSQIL
ncbi:Tellurite resistance protein TehB homolog [Mannheimia haemolytica]|uniref:Tellurite resistance protein TehB homolog n=1 Tax=Mannheimia haemolytica TaxID=75985 RepID=A0A378NB98_MANHA|nr:Tellurite resistance protein TehB homolog [Mannheimia haemolytica]